MCMCMSFQVICNKCKKESTFDNTEVDIEVEGDVCCGMYVTFKLKCTSCNKAIIIKYSFG